MGILLSSTISAYKLVILPNTKVVKAVHDISPCLYQRVEAV